MACERPGFASFDLVGDRSESITRDVSSTALSR